MHKLFSEYIHNARFIDEVVKYCPDGYNNKGQYIYNEWTDVSDIGKRFNSSRLSYTDYLRIESKYIDFALCLVRMSKCKFISVYKYNLECDNQEIIVTDRIDPVHPLSTANILEELGDLSLHKRLSEKDFSLMLRLSLRGYIGCAFVNYTRKIQIDVGWDYYLHVFAPLLDYRDLFRISNQHQLFCNPRGGILFGGTVWDKLYDRIKDWLQDISSENVLDFTSFEIELGKPDIWRIYYLALRCAMTLQYGCHVALDLLYNCELSDTQLPVQEYISQSERPIRESLIKFRGDMKNTFGMIAAMPKVSSASVYYVYRVESSEGSHLVVL